MAEAFDRLTEAVRYVAEHAEADPDQAGAIATDLLDLAGYTLYAWFWADMVRVCEDDGFGRAKRDTADFYFSRILPRTQALAASVCSPSAAVMRIDDDAL